MRLQPRTSVETDRCMDLIQQIAVVEVHDLCVDVGFESVLLTGRAGSWHAKQVATNAARRMYPNHRIENILEVTTIRESSRWVAATVSDDIGDGWKALRSVVMHGVAGKNEYGRKERFVALCAERSISPVTTLQAAAASARAWWLQEEIASSWTTAKDQRRCTLIDRSLHEELTVAEQRELADLQRQAEAHFDEVASPPIDGALKLHAQLIKLAGRQNE